MKKEFEEFYKRHYDLVAKYIFRQVGDGDVTEDIVQDIFCLAYEKWENVSEHPCPEGWLLRTAKYKLLEYWRKMEKRKAVSIEELELVADDENYGMVEIEAVAEANLKMEEWNLMKSYYLEDKNVSVLAEQAGVADTCMRMRISRVTRKLRAVLMEREQREEKKNVQ